MLNFFIALYGTRESSDYHVALFASEINAPLTGAVNVFQIVTQRYGYAGEDGYMHQHGPATVMKSGRFICAMRFPCVNLTMPELEIYMSTQYPGQRGSKLIESPTNRWDCFQWSMRSIKGLIDMNVMVTESTNSFFTRAAANHVYWGKMILVAITKAGHDVLVNCYVADMSLGIPMMDFRASGIFL